MKKFSSFLLMAMLLFSFVPSTFAITYDAELVLSPFAASTSKSIDESYSNDFEFVEYRIESNGAALYLDEMHFLLSEDAWPYVEELVLYDTRLDAVVDRCDIVVEGNCFFENLNYAVVANKYLDLAVKADFNSQFSDASPGVFQLELIDVEIEKKDGNAALVLMSDELESVEFSFGSAQEDAPNSPYLNDQWFNEDEPTTLMVELFSGLDLNQRVYNTTDEYLISKYVLVPNQDSVLQNVTLFLDGDSNENYFSYLRLYSSEGLIDSCDIDGTGILNCNNLDFSLETNQNNYIYLKARFEDQAFEEGGEFQVELIDLMAEDYSGDEVEYSSLGNVKPTISMIAKEENDVIGDFDAIFAQLPKKIGAGDSKVKIAKMKIDSSNGADLYDFEWMHNFDGDLASIDSVYFLDDKGKVLDKTEIVNKRTTLETDKIESGKYYYLAIDVKDNAPDNQSFYFYLAKAEAEDMNGDKMWFDTAAYSDRFEIVDGETEDKDSALDERLGGYDFELEYFDNIIKKTDHRYRVAEFVLEADSILGYRELNLELNMDKNAEDVKYVYLYDGSVILDKVEYNRTANAFSLEGEDLSVNKKYTIEVEFDQIPSSRSELRLFNVFGYDYNNDYANYVLSATNASSSLMLDGQGLNSDDSKNFYQSSDGDLVDFIYHPDDKFGVKVGEEETEVLKFKVWANSDDVYLGDFEFTTFGKGAENLESVTVVAEKNKITRTSFGDIYNHYPMNFGIELDKGEYEIFTVYVNADDVFSGSKDAYVSLTSVEAKKLNSHYFVPNDLPLISYGFKVLGSGSSSSYGTFDGSVTRDKEYEEEILVKTANPFADFNAEIVSSLNGKAAIYLDSLNIINGYLVSEEPLVVEFRGFNKLNRAEALKFIVNSMNIPDSEMSNNKIFSDVDTDDWFSKYISTGYDLGIIEGYQDGTFKPGQEVNKMEFVKMLVEAHGLKQDVAFNYDDVDSSKWYAPYVGISQKLDLFPSEENTFDGKVVLDRWATSLAVYQLIK